jgi:xanthine dehydrogenase large subunit
VTGVPAAAATHDSAVLHVTGRARYCDDIALPANTLHAAFGVSPVAHGRLRGLNLDAVRTAPGVVAVVHAADVPGENNYGGAVHDDPIFAAASLCYAGQPVFAVAATSMNAARRAVRAAQFDVEALPALLDIRAALAAQSFVLPSERVTRGNPVAQLAAAALRLRGSFQLGGQDHFYLEGQIAIALPQDDGSIVIHSSTQHPTEVQNIVAHALGWEANRVTVLCRRMGGGFGGKESQPALLAATCAVLALRTGRAVKLRLERDADMIITGKRHDFIADYDVGFDATGRLLALSVMLASRCGYSADLSGPVNDRAMFHLDNAYYLEHLAIESHRCLTHTVSNTAFRGFGGPQGMLVIETILDDIARTLDLDPLDVRRTNLYGIGIRDLTPYGQRVEHNLGPLLFDRLEKSSDYRQRRAEIDAFNSRRGVLRRGLALTPVKFGISFTSTMYNQAGALLQIYADGSVLLNHGGTEMGQGLHTKVIQVVARELGLPLHAVRITTTDTSKVPNTSATAASSGSDLNGMAAREAARSLRARLVGFLAAREGIDEAQITIAEGVVRWGSSQLPFSALTRAAYAARISLSATGFYRTPGLHWDRANWTGKPFYYFAWGAAVSEVIIDTLTGETRLLRVDILHDVGSSLNEAIDRGQIEGGYLQGVGWLTSEELWWNERGELKTHAPSTYKIPTARDWPADARIELLRNTPNPVDTIYRSKAVGEPPLMLGISAFHAIRDACASCAPPGTAIPLRAPATPEAVLDAVRALRTEHAA